MFEDANAGGVGPFSYDLPRSSASLSATIDALRSLQRTRQFCIKSQQRIDRACESFIARAMGFNPDAPEKERKALWTRVSTFLRNVEGKKGHAGGDDQHGDALSSTIPIILHSAASRRCWDDLRGHTEKTMRQLARSLPVYAWASGVKGFGDLGLAIIIGETGDLSGYATKERVWKRLGLAVIEGHAQQRKTGKEAAAAHGYAPKRRAEVWTIANSMFKHQWHGAKEDREAGPSGPYGEVYGARKAATEGREWTGKHRDNDARRVMTKALIADLWRAWNENA